MFHTLLAAICMIFRISLGLLLYMPAEWQAGVHQERHDETVIWSSLYGIIISESRDAHSKCIMFFFSVRQGSTASSDRSPNHLFADVCAATAPLVRSKTISIVSRVLLW